MEIDYLGRRVRLVSFHHTVGSQTEERDIIIRIDAFTNKFRQKTILAAWNGEILPMHDDSRNGGIRVIKFSCESGYEW